MKIKDKISGEVYEAETWKNWNGAVQYVKKGTNGPIRQSNDVEIIKEDEPIDTTDWELFRREAAKNILAGMISALVLINIEGKQLKTFEDFANAAIGITDKLIAKLKEK